MKQPVHLLLAALTCAASCAVVPETLAAPRRASKSVVSQTSCKKDVRTKRCRVVKKRRTPAPPTPTATPTRTPTPTPTATPAPPIPTPTAVPLPVADLLPPIPELARWELQMTEMGRVHCQALSSTRVDADGKLAATYYDAQWVFRQIAHYTSDSSWFSCADAAEKVYREYYVLPNGGNVPGYWNFSHGLARDYLETGDERSRAAVRELAENAAYARDTTPSYETADVALSREVAYAIMTYLNAEDIGAPRRARLPLLVDHALGHIDQWFDGDGSAKSFMVGLTAHALITVYERTGDARVIPALVKALDRLWEINWVAESEAFRYQTHGTAEEQAAAADLNLLIAPAYAWLYRTTGEPRFLERGDRIFAGGVRGAYLGNGKHFNQNYRWSFEYVKLRR